LCNREYYFFSWAVAMTDANSLSLAVFKLRIYHQALYI